MNTFAIVALFAALAAANASLIAAPSTKIIQGPSTRTTVVGPDGSSISSVAPGGSIIAEDHSGLVAETGVIAAAPVVAHTAYAAPVVAHTAYAAPVLARTAYAHTAYAAPALGYAASGFVAHNGLDTVVAGPSGTVATSRGVYNAPTVYAQYGAPLAYAHHGLYY